jgi:hypothetical protein
MPKWPYNQSGLPSCGWLALKGVCFGWLVGRPVACKLQVVGSSTGNESAVDVVQGPRQCVWWPSVTVFAAVCVSVMAVDG